MATKQIISNSDLTNVVTNMVHAATKQPGVTAAEVGGSANSGLSATVRLGQVDVVEFSRDKALSITVYKGQSKGSVSITDLTAPAIESAITAACRIAEYTEADKYAGLADKDQLAKTIPNLDLHHPAGISAEQAIESAKQCEAAALDFSKEISNSEGATFVTNEQFYVYANSLGFVGAYPTTRYAAYCRVIGQRGDSMQADYDFTVARDVNDMLNLNMVGKKSAEKTLARLGARKINTCKVPVLFAPKMAVQLWANLISAISGSNLYRKSSFLLDSLNHQLFPDFINISEQPFIPKALGSAPFDSEGVATREKSVVQNGVLQSYILGSYSARRLGMQTTGNAGGVHNLVIEPGMQDYQQLIKQMHRGLVVTELMGHGTNLVTGDTSHGAVGFWVENGEIAYPVEEITVAGNLKQMFKDIVAVGNDVDYRANILTGSVLLAEMTVAGD